MRSATPEGRIRGNASDGRLEAVKVLGRLLVALAALAVLIGAPKDVSAKVFASQKQALAEAFPEATRIERRTFVLRDEQVAKIESMTGEKVRAKVVVIHVAYQGDAVLGFAEIAVHTVRTQPEALLIVLTPEGRVRTVRIIAFHEPLDYLPTEPWYAQFVGKGKGDRLQLGREIHGVVGATLSAQAAVDGVRRILGYFEVLLRPAYGTTGAP
jgi:Na+-translocating ferredoxin:NAD+ oxidoreductase RnfG subunit